MVLFIETVKLWVTFVYGMVVVINMNIKYSCFCIYLHFTIWFNFVWGPQESRVNKQNWFLPPLLFCHKI